MPLYVVCTYIEFFNLMVKVHWTSSSSSIFKPTLDKKFPMTWQMIDRHNDFEPSTQRNNEIEITHAINGVDFNEVNENTIL